MSRRSLGARGPKVEGHTGAGACGLRADDWIVEVSCLAVMVSRACPTAARLCGRRVPGDRIRPLSIERRKGYVRALRGS